MYYHYGILYGLFHILWWVLVIAFVLWILRLLRGGPRYHNRFRHGDGYHKDALDILKERYAKGEINKEEFEEKKKDLS